MRQKAIEGSVGWTLGQASQHQALSGEGRDQDSSQGGGQCLPWTGELMGFMIYLGGLL